MSLTAEQIELLPPQQKAQVLALQQQLVSDTCVNLAMSYPFGIYRPDRQLFLACSGRKEDSL